jgi:hypothetical protein
MPTVTVTAEVDVDSFLDELSNEDLEEALRCNNRLAIHRWSDVRAALLRGDTNKAQEIIAQIADKQAGVLLVFDRTPLRRVA